MSTSSPKNEPSQEKTDVRKEVFSWILVIAEALIIALLLNTFIIVNATVPSGSMENTIQPGDRLFGLRLTYLFKDPVRKDIVVFRYPVDASLGKKTNYIKRIIGLPGETVEIIDGKVYIDGSTEPLDDSFLTVTPIGNFGPFEVPEDCYFMLGDNRNNSKDSRFWTNKYVRFDQIIGKAIFRYWPLNSMKGLANA